MTALQHKMFMKQISSLHVAKYGAYTFEIKHLIKNVYKLVQMYNGVILELYTGSETDCISAAEECLDMITTAN